MGKNAVIGLNIGSNTIKAVELQKTRAGIEVTGLGITPTPEDAFSNGVIIAPDVMAACIRDLLSSNGMRTKSVVSSVAGQTSLVVRIIEVPKMSDAELKETMSYEVERHIPFAATEVIMDFKPLHPPDENPDAQNMEVLLCVAQEDMINAHVDTLEGAGLQPRAIDIEPLAAARATVELLGEQTPGETIALLNMGSSVTDISVIRDGLLTFTRAVPIAGDALTQAVVEAFGMEKFEAERIKKELGTAILEEPEVSAVDFTGGAAPAAGGDFATVGEQGDTGTMADFDFTGEQSLTGANAATIADSNPFDTSDMDSETPFGITESTPGVTADTGGSHGVTEGDNAGIPAADAQSAEAPEAAAENPFDLSLDLAPPAVPEPSAPENPFDFSLDAPTPETPPPAPAPPAEDVSPFSFSLDIEQEPSPQPVVEESAPAPQVSEAEAAPAPSPPEPAFSLDFGEPEPLEEDGVAPPVGGFDLGGETQAERAAPAEPLFDVTGPTGGDSLSATGEVSETQSSTSTSGASTSPGMSPFLQEEEDAVGDAISNADDLFNQDNPFADSVVPVYGQQQEVTPAAVYQAISPVLAELVTETRRSLEYYTGRYPNVTISRLIILGGTASLKHIDKYLSNELGIRVVVANPFEQMAVRAKGVPPEYVEDLAPSLAVSAGLALRDML